MGGRKVSEEERREQLLAAAYEVAVRDGLDGVTARSVAAAAGTSHGLVFFHFGSVHGLLLALLEQLLAGALDAEITDELAALPPRARLREMLRIELEGLPEQRGAVELFFAYWLRREPAFRDRIDAALDRYREVFRAACADLPGGDPDALAGVAVALVHGASVQVVRAPDAFSVQAYLTALFPEPLAAGSGACSGPSSSAAR